MCSPQNVRYADQKKVCEHYFGAPRQNSTSHSVFKTTWNGDPRVNIQNKNGMAKSYQIKQVLNAIIEDMRKNKESVPEPITSKHYSGKFIGRVPPQVHRKLAIEGAESDVSLNRLASSKLCH
jgi:predicted HicB family RNase H-like nuclease